MPRGPVHVDSKGACIYCGATDTRLSDEHVVPYSHGGAHVIRKASCGRCADITKKFEQKVARDLWGDARIAFDAPLRRKSQRKARLVMPGRNTSGPGCAVAAEEYPAGFVFYKMCQAGMLQGLPANVDVSGSWQFVVIDDKERRERFLEKYPGRDLVIRFRHAPREFGQLLAKIGYGQVLTQLDPEDFRPLCVPYILGYETNVSYIVGGAFEEQAAERGNGYSLKTAGFGGPDKLLLLALIRGTPGAIHHDHVAPYLLLVAPRARSHIRPAIKRNRTSPATPAGGSAGTGSPAQVVPEKSSISASQS